MSFFISAVKSACQRKRRARIWSNQELGKFAHIFSGRAINVSGWCDQDKQGRRYRDYFDKVQEYFVSNIQGDKGLSGVENEIFLDLEKPLEEKLKKQFDVVFCHTVLEHVYYEKQALDNLCLLSKDIVLLVVPFFQEQHTKGSYGDYWRFTPMGVVRGFKQRGFQVLYLSATPYKNNPVYVFAIATCNFEKWQKRFSPIVISSGIVNNFAKPNIICRIIIWLAKTLK